MAWSMRAPLSAGRAQGRDECAAICLAGHLAHLSFSCQTSTRYLYTCHNHCQCALSHCTRQNHYIAKPISLGTPTFLPHPAVLYRILPYRAITPCPVVPCLAVPYLPISWNVLQYPILPHPAISCFLLPSTYTCQDGSTPTCSHFLWPGRKLSLSSVKPLYFVTKLGYFFLETNIVITKVWGCTHKRY